MINQENINYSLRNLNHRKSRSLLTIFSILIGIATIFIFVSFGHGLYNYIDSVTSASSANKIIVMAKGIGLPGTDDSFKLNDDDLRAVEKSAGVYEASGVYYDVVQVKKRNKLIYTFLIAYAPQTPLIMDVFNIGVEEGRMLKKGDKKSAVFGYNYLLDDKIFEKGLELNDVVEINGEKIKVIGFMESIGNPQDDSQIYVTNDYFEELIPEKDTYAQIVARTDTKIIDKTISNVERNLRKQRNLEEGKEDFFVQSFEGMIESYSGALDIIIAFVILIALISILVSAINTANTMITSVLERFKEIGILKAIGSRNSTIFHIFLFESAFLGFVAGCIGVLLGFGFTSVAEYILNNLGWGLLSPYYTPSLFIGCILFATLTGAVSGVIPALRASKTNIVEAIRYE